MASNGFGSIFRYSTWGESHGKAVGVIIDGCPAGIPVDEDTINQELARRAPGSSSYVSPRGEKDLGSIYSGIFEGLTTGAPVSIIIQNNDADSSKYAAIANLMRPGHANYTYLAKYGLFDYHGGGRSSARETIGRVAAGAVARKFLQSKGIEAFAFLSSVGTATASEIAWDKASAYSAKSPIFAPDQSAELAFMNQIDEAMQANDSVGGIVSFVAQGLPAGLGDPVYGKLEAMLASAMLSIQASKGFEIGGGFSSASMRGSDFNDTFISENGAILPASNNAGGTLGGISTGLPVYGRVAFKPTASIFQTQHTVDMQGNPSEFILPKGSRHDPCVAVRAVPVVEAMCLIVLADAWLMNLSAKN